MFQDAFYFLRLFDNFLGRCILLKAGQHHDDRERIADVIVECRKLLEVLFDLPVEPVSLLFALLFLRDVTTYGLVLGDVTGSIKECPVAPLLPDNRTVIFDTPVLDYAQRVIRYE